MADIDKIYKDLVEEAQRLTTKEQELKQKLSKVSKLKEENKKRKSKIVELERELRDLLG